ncbi:MAG: Ig-like domain-containing protein [Candidatus Goldbacteria bacterium]|nr:Ig-like domain-containing protein [Candidatus Goldiibacteriota bacterium]
MKKVMTGMAVFILFIINNCATGGMKASDITGIKVTPEVLKVKVGKSIEMTAVGITKDGKTIDIYPAWEIDAKDKKIGTINKTTGSKITFTGRSPGIAKIVVTIGDIAKQVKITVVK